MTSPRLHCEDDGTGFGIFLLHAFPLDHTMWAHQNDRLRKRWRVLAPDAFGFGSSPLGPSPWTVADLARSCLGLADERGLERFAVVGLSMGGYAAFELWRQAPDRIAALVLANTRARGDTSAEKAARADLRTQVENAGVGILPMAMLGKLLSSTAPTGAVEFVRNAIGRTTPPAIGQALEALAGRTDSTALLSEITCPVLVIAGSDDEITGTGEVHSMAEAMRGARIVEIQGAGHLSNLESPGPFSDALESFLESALTG